MKNNKTKTLRLNKETVRSLTPSELGAAAGGMIVPITTVPTHLTCHTCYRCPTWTHLLCTA